MKVAFIPNPSGSAYWRLHDPAKYLRTQNVEAEVITTGITDDLAQYFDIVVLQGCVDKQGIALLRAYQQEAGLKIVVDCDDYIIPAEDNPYKIEHEIYSYDQVVIKTMQIADLVTVTTKPLQKEMLKYNKNVQILPNYMDLQRWDLPKLTNTSKRIRIGWAGSMTHISDLRMIVEPLKRIKSDYPQVEYIFMGDPRIAKEFDFPVEAMLGVSFDEWPARLHGLRLDIGLAPLLDTRFNRCKSNIKWLEYSIAKVPGVFSPTVYQHTKFEPGFGLVASTPDEWYGAIKHYIEYPQRREEVRENAYKHVVDHYDLKRHVNEWMKCYKPLIS